MPLIGHTQCKECGAEGIPVYQTAGGKVYAACHRCETAMQPKPGSKGHRALMARMVPVEGDEPAAAPKPAPDPAPAPAPAAKGFQMGAL